MRFVKLLAMIILATVSVHAQGIGGKSGFGGKAGFGGGASGSLNTFTLVQSSTKTTCSGSTCPITVTSTGSGHLGFLTVTSTTNGAVVTVCIWSRNLGCPSGVSGWKRARANKLWLHSV